MSMIIISQLIPCKPFSLSSQISQLSPKSPLLLLSATANSLRPSSSSSSSFPSHKSINRRPGARWEFQVLTADDERERFSGAAAVVAEPPVAAKIEEVKKRSVDEFYGTDRGLRASSETRAQIVELINQLESLNPNPAPTQALSLLNGNWILASVSLSLLNGNWILAYTSFSGLFPLLLSTTLPLVKVEEISQTIDSENFTVQNSVKFAGPLATTSVSTNAKFEVCSPKRVQIKFVEGISGTPQLTDSIVIPENVEFLGQKFDLTPFKGLLNSVQDTASSVARTISSQPPLKFNLPEKAESWLLTTYLDEELRMSRGNGGSVFVLIKEGSPLM